MATHIPYGRQTIDRKDIAAVVATLGSTWLTQGPRVQRFEEEIASVSGTRYAVAVANGTVALHLAYLVAGIGKGDEVITTPNTFVATTNMLLSLGARPVFCDIRLDTYNIDEKEIEKLITKKTKAIVPVHFAGAPVNMDVILSIAKRRKLMVIADGAHALGAQYKGKPVGSHGLMTTYSFHPVKSITTGEGGAIVTNDLSIYKKLCLLRSHGIEKDTDGFNVMNELGYNYRMTDLQAALGVTQLAKLESFITKRRAISRWYEDELYGIDGIVLPNANIDSSWHLYVIRVKDPQDRLPLANHLRAAGIGVNFHYPAVYAHPYYRKNGYGATRLENADIYAQSSITLPLFPTLTKKEVRFVVNIIKGYFSA